MLHFSSIDIDANTKADELNATLQGKKLAMWWVMDIRPNVKRLWFAERIDPQLNDEGTGQKPTPTMQ